MQNPILVLIPVIAITITLVVVLLLILWWTSSQPDEIPVEDFAEGDDEQAEGDVASTPEEEPVINVPQGDDLTLGQVFDDVKEAVGGMLSNLRSSNAAVKELRSQNSESSIQLPDPDSLTLTRTMVDTPSPTAPRPQMRAASLPAASGDAVEVMRLLRDLADGSLIVEINGRRYRTLSEISDPQTGRRFVGNAQALAEFAHLTEIEMPEVPADDLNTAEPGWVSSEPVTIPGHDPQLQSERSVAQQVDDILQLRLESHPTLSGRSIRVRSSMDGGVRIDVDGTVYEAVEDIEEEAVRTFLQSVIQEWETYQ